MENLFAGLRAVLFDLDGTLIETHIDFGQMKREMLALAARCGLPPDDLAARDILSIVETAVERLAAAGRETEAGRFRAEAFARLEAIETAHCAAPAEIPGAADLLRLLRARGMRVGIVTRNCRTVSERLLVAGRLACDVLLTRDDVPRAKPDPGHLLAALAALNAPRPTPDAPRPALMVGDHWMDVQAGRAAGLRTVGLLCGRPVETFAPAPPDLLLDTLADLLPLAGGGDGEKG